MKNREKPKKSRKPGIRKGKPPPLVEKKRPSPIQSEKKKCKLGGKGEIKKKRTTPSGKEHVNHIIPH